MDVPAGVRAIAESLGEIPAYVYDLDGLRRHAAAAPDATTPTHTHRAVNANPERKVLRALGPYGAGFEVASAGAFQRVTEVVPGMPVSFGGPGKTTDELALAPLVHRWH